MRLLNAPRAMAVLATLACHTADSFPGPGPHGASAEWLARNDSLRASFMTMAESLPQNGGVDSSLSVAAFDVALVQARSDMKGLGDPHVYCISYGPPRALRSTLESVRAGLREKGASFYDVRQCDVDRGLGVWAERQRRAWLLWVTNAVASRDSAVATVGFHSEMLAAASWECSFSTSTHGWKLTHCNLLWIS